METYSEERSFYTCFMRSIVDLKTSNNQESAPTQILQKFTRRRRAWSPAENKTAPAPHPHAPLS